MVWKSVAASVLAVASAVQAQSSTCPFNYPAQLTSTESRNGLTFSVISTNPLTNDRALQLRTNPFFTGGFFVGVDDHSPVLLGNMRQAAIYSQARNEFNQLGDLGPTGYLNLNTEVNGTARYTVGFANATIWPGTVEAQWELLGGSSDGTYSLFHQEDVGVTHGFLLCNSETDLDHGPWYQLYYENYTAPTGPYEFPNCEHIGVRTTVAATILNGDCDIGGVTA
ncbi:hypothetical protein GQ53DRAFT_881379 [Thozetella sp. PMI_491]|nr:hypothetical protein GQ53DRAFT_881379 [Thozetella sp. PMI_491]